MLRILAATLITFTMSFASASLMKDAMKEMGKEFKKINQTISDSSENQNNAARAQHIEKLLMDVMHEIPVTVNDLPSAQQEAAFARYQQMTQQAVTLAQQLAQAFLNNDTDTAMNVFQEMSDLMDHGHDEFEPQ